MPPDPERARVVRALACCIARAKIVSGRGIDSGNDVYWHTREACLVIARSKRIMTQHVIRELGLVSDITVRGLPSKEVLELSAPYWAVVCHPDVLAREVMET